MTNNKFTIKGRVMALDLGEKRIGVAISDPTRTIAQFAHWERGSIDMSAAFTAANGLETGSTGSGEFRGVDQASPSSCREPDITAIRVSNSSPEPIPHTTTGSSPKIDASGSPSDVANATGIDWAATIGGGVVPDYTTIKTWDASYPVMLVTGDVTFNVNSTWCYGTLIVTGDLTITGTRLQWYGVVLVGGKIEFDNTDARFDGIVISGLNRQFSGSPGKGELGDDYVDIDFDSNYVRRAMRSFAGFVPIANAWADNWATY
jgi:hypothetical protein